MSTRKDYIKFADLFADEKAIVESHLTNNHMCVTPAKLAMLDNLKFLMADIFARDNPRFNRQRFYKACEPKKGDL